jgi:hypothetical protein
VVVAAAYPLVVVVAEETAPVEELDAPVDELEEYVMAPVE